CLPGESAFAAMVTCVDPAASSKVAVPVIWLPLFGSKVAVALVGVFEQAASETATASRTKRCMLDSSSQKVERRMMAEVAAEDNCRTPRALGSRRGASLQFR